MHTSWRKYKADNPGLCLCPMLLPLSTLSSSPSTEMFPEGSQILQLNNEKTSIYC